MGFTQNFLRVLHRIVTQHAAPVRIFIPTPLVALVRLVFGLQEIQTLARGVLVLGRLGEVPELFRPVHILLLDHGHRPQLTELSLQELLLVCPVHLLDFV